MRTRVPRQLPRRSSIAAPGRPTTGEGEQRADTMPAVLMAILRDWPTTWRCVVLLAAVAAFVILALWFLPIEITIGPSASAEHRSEAGAHRLVPTACRRRYTERGVTYVLVTRRA